MQTFYRLMADAVLVVHLAYIAFVVGGLILILIGAALRWQWVRALRFRMLHLAAIAIVVLFVQVGVACPLTSIEASLRQHAGQQHYADEGWMEYWLHELIAFDIPSWAFTLAYTLFGVAVAATFLLIPPRRALPADRHKKRDEGLMLAANDGR